MTEEANRRGPLAGTVVLDLTRVLAGPVCGMVLYNLGARVIKVERPGSGDDSRAFPPFIEGRTGYFDSINYGKESIALNFKKPDDTAVFRDLLNKADVIVENFRPGVMDRLGFGWDELHVSYPHVISASISGFGQTGPYSTHPAYDMVVQSMSGLVSVTGPAGKDRPVRVGSSFADIYAGLLCALGILNALVDRERTASGSKVDVAMLDGQLSVLATYISAFSVEKINPAPMGSGHPSFCPFGVYSVSDGQVALSTLTDGQFRALCQALGIEELADDPAFARNDQRRVNRVALDAHLTQVLKTWRGADLQVALTDAGVSCGPLQTIKDLVENPILRDRDMLKCLDDEIYKKHNVVIAGNPIKFDMYRDPEKWPAAPAIDGNRDEIMAWLQE